MIRQSLKTLACLAALAAATNAGAQEKFPLKFAFGAPAGDAVRGEHSIYRDAKRLEELYGRLPEQTLSTLTFGRAWARKRRGRSGSKFSPATR